MALYRANDRHPADDRILIVKSLDEFKLWQERASLSIHGIMFKHPFESQTVQEAAAHLSTLARLRNSPFHVRKNEGDIPNSKELIFSTDLEHDDYLRGQFEAAGIGYPANHIIRSLSNAFGQAIGGIEAGKRFFSSVLRVNDASVTGFHKHTASMIYAFKKQGVVCRSGEALDEGDEYQIGSNTALIIDKAVPHKSPDFKKSWKSDPRVHVVMIAPE